MVRAENHSLAFGSYHLYLYSTLVPGERNSNSTPAQSATAVRKFHSFLTLKIEKIEKQKIRYGSVHLDVWFDNLHIDDEEGITFFDFDFCGNGYLCFDISYFLFQLLATNLNEEDYQIKADSFLKGYGTVTEISNEEKEFLHFACLAIMTYYIAVQCDRFEYWTNLFLNEDHLKRMVRNMKRWIAYNKIEINTNEKTTNG